MDYKLFSDEFEFKTKLKLKSMSNMPAIWWLSIYRQEQSVKQPNEIDTRRMVKSAKSMMVNERG